MIALVRRGADYYKACCNLRTRCRNGAVKLTAENEFYLVRGFRAATPIMAAVVRRVLVTSTSWLATSESTIYPLNLPMNSVRLHTPWFSSSIPVEYREAMDMDLWRMTG